MVQKANKTKAPEVPIQSEAQDAQNGNRSFYDVNIFLFIILYFKLLLCMYANEIVYTIIFLL